MVPQWAEWLFLFAAFWTLLFLRLASRSRLVMMIVLLWGGLHLWLVSRDFYAIHDSIPPRPLFMLGPAVLSVTVLLIVPRSRAWMRTLDLRLLAMIHVARIPVEIVLHQAALSGSVPVMMTWSGTNMDIFSGVSAAFIVAYLTAVKKPSRALLIAWNIACLLLLVNVVTTAILSLPSSIQVLNFDQPNRLVLGEPYVLLPAVIVPVVLWAHAAALARLFGPRTT